jgi:hypothetical protein
MLLSVNDLDQRRPSKFIRVAICKFKHTRLCMSLQMQHSTADGVGSAMLLLAPLDNNLTTGFHADLPLKICMLMANQSMGQVKRAIYPNELHVGNRRRPMGERS